jgi:hypothetical protein
MQLFFNETTQKRENEAIKFQTSKHKLIDYHELEQTNQPESIRVSHGVEWCRKLPGLASEYHDSSLTFFLVPWCSTGTISSPFCVENEGFLFLELR